MAATDTSKHVVILGGGYAGMYACRRLSKAARQGRIRLTVISKENFHIWHGFIGEMITGRIMPTQILSPVRRIFRHAKLHIGKVTNINPISKSISVIRELDGRAFEVHYDQLIIALGSRQRTEHIPGLSEHGFALKTWDDCYQLRNHIIRMFELASITPDIEERKAMLSFFIAGGGFSGSEVAGELADFAKLLIKKDFPELDHNEVRVVLAHPQETILPELFGDRVNTLQSMQYPGLVAYAQRHLEKIGVEVMTSCRIEAVSRNLVVIEDGTRVPTRTVICAVGTVAQSCIRLSKLPITGNGKIEVGKDLKVMGMEDLYAVGDCAAVQHPKGGFVPGTAWWGMMAGYHAADNLLRELDHKAPRPFRKTGLGQAVSIGRRTAVGEFKGIALRGFLAWLMWRAVLYYYFPNSDRKLRLLVDWILWPFAGRDIVEMSVDDSDDFEIRRVKFQADEFILYQGQTGHSLYLILEGEAMAIKDVDLDGRPDEIRRIRHGELVGHTFENGICPYHVKAITAVKAIEFRHDQIHELDQVFALYEKAKGNS